MHESIDLLEDLNFEDILTDKEMKRVIRFMLAFEDEAFWLYLHLMTSTENIKISTVFKEIADEKRFQVSQLIRLLRELDAFENPLH
jgi:rubrerythrin